MDLLSRLVWASAGIAVFIGSLFGAYTSGVREGKLIEKSTILQKRTESLQAASQEVLKVNVQTEKKKRAALDSVRSSVILKENLDAIPRSSDCSPPEYVSVLRGAIEEGNRAISAASE